MVNAVTSLLSLLCKIAMALLIALVALQFLIVIARYLLGTNFIWAQELVTILHACIFMISGGAAFLSDKHVRLDVFHEHLGKRQKRNLDAFGTVFLLLPMMAVIGWYSADYVAESWAIREGSAEVSGLPGRYLVKSLIPLFAFIMMAAGIARTMRFRA